MSFPSLFALVANKEVLVAEVSESKGGGGLVPFFTRSFNDWEMEEAQSILQAIQGLNIIIYYVNIS